MLCAQVSITGPSWPSCFLFKDGKHFCMFIEGPYKSKVVHEGLYESKVVHEGLYESKVVQVHANIHNSGPL